MSFQAYIDTIKEKTGYSPEDFKKITDDAGIIHTDMKAREFCDYISQHYGLGHGHCMALWNVFITNGWVETKHTKLKNTSKK